MIRVAAGEPRTQGLFLTPSPDDPAGLPRRTCTILILPRSRASTRPGAVQAGATYDATVGARTDRGTWVRVGLAPAVEDRPCVDGP
jgi:hypothetical protein